MQQSILTVIRILANQTAFLSSRYMVLMSKLYKPSGDHVTCDQLRICWRGWSGGSSRTGYSGKLLGRSKMGRDEEQTAKTGQLGGSTPGEMLRTPARLLTLAQPSPAQPAHTAASFQPIPSRPGAALPCPAWPHYLGAPDNLQISQTAAKSSSKVEHISVYSIHVPSKVWTLLCVQQSAQAASQQCSDPALE